MDVPENFVRRLSVEGTLCEKGRFVEGMLCWWNALWMERFGNLGNTLWKGRLVKGRFFELKNCSGNFCGNTDCERDALWTERFIGRRFFGAPLFRLNTLSGSITILCLYWILVNILSGPCSEFKCQFHDLVVIYQGNITTGNEVVRQWLTTGLRPAVATTRQFHFQQ